MDKVLDLQGKMTEVHYAEKGRADSGHSLYICLQSNNSLPLCAHS